MDTAVSLVQAYLYANGYLTMTEYPILELGGPDSPRMVTDIDVLAVRFRGAGRPIEGSAYSGIVIDPDPALELTDHLLDVIIGEVKEGTAELNRSARTPAVVSAAIGRIGHMLPDRRDALVEQIVRTGEAIHPSGLRFRQMVFASRPPDHQHPDFSWLSHGHISLWLRQQIREHWGAMKAVQSKDPALGLMLLAEKAERGES